MCRWLIIELGCRTGSSIEGFFFVTSTVPGSAVDIQFCYEGKPGGTCGLSTAVQH
jgi:hypothetical protein